MTPVLRVIDKVAKTCLATAFAIAAPWTTAAETASVELDPAGLCRHVRKVAAEIKGGAIVSYRDNSGRGTAGARQRALQDIQAQVTRCNARDACETAYAVAMEGVEDLPEERARAATSTSEHDRRVCLEATVGAAQPAR